MPILPGIYNLAQRSGGFVHAYLIEDGASLILVDSLFDTDAHRILGLIAHIGRRVEDLKHIILTHAHRSHLGGAAVLQQLSGAQVYAHEWEADIISGDRQAQKVTLLPHPPLRAYPLQLGLALGFGKHPPVKVDHFIHEGDQIGPLKTLFIPGHSPGHLGFYWEAQRLLIAGDAVATWPVFELGWRGFTLNQKMHIQSLHRLAELDCQTLCVGHGDPILSDGATLIRNALTTLKD